MRTSLFVICCLLLNILYAIIESFDLEGWGFDLFAGLIALVIIAILLVKDWEKTRRL